MSEGIDNILKTPDLKDLYLKFLKITPTTYTVRKIPTSPCKVACPIDTDVKAYLGLIFKGKFKKSLEIIEHHNPLRRIW